MNNTRSKQKLGRIQSVDRALTILDILAETKEGYTLAQLSQRMDLPKSTIHGLLSTLRDKDFVRQSKETGKYILGLHLFDLGTKVANSWGIRDSARPAMRWLSQEFGETVHIGCEDNGEVLYMEKIAADSLVKIVSDVGARLPMHCSAIGKVLLASKSDAEIKRYIADKGLTPLTGRTITDPDELFEELIKIRKQGYAIDDGEFADGLRCVGAPILDEDGLTRFAISVAGQMKDIYGKRLERLIIETKRAAKEISYNIKKNNRSMKG